MKYSIIKNGCDCYPWTQCFVWWPKKTITGKNIWGIKAYKRKVWVVWGYGFHMDPEIQYATFGELLAGEGDKFEYCG